MPDQLYVLVGSDQVGPITQDDVRSRVASGEVNGSSLCWYDGLPDWQPLEQVLPDLLAAPAPAAPAPAPAAEADMDKTVMAVDADALKAAEADARAAAEAKAAAEAAAAEAAAAQPAPAPEPAPAPAAAPAAAPMAAAPVDPAPAAPAAVNAELAERVPVNPEGTVISSAGSAAATFEVLDTGYHKMARITLSNGEIQVESGAMHYMRGPIEIEAKMPSMKGIGKALLTKENVVRPKYRGSGQLYLEPTFGELNLMTLNNEEWVLDKGAFFAADNTIELGVFTNKSIAGLLGGEGLFQTKVSGSGVVLYNSDGPVQRLDLNNDRLVVDGSFAVARSASLNFKVERAVRGGTFASMRSGEGLVNTLEGTGTVYIAPVPNRSLQLFRALTPLAMMATRRK